MQHYQRIRDLREDNDLTQQQLCEKLYMHKTTYTNYEQGKHSVPLDFAVTLADFYSVSLDYLAGRTNKKEPFLSDKAKKEKLPSYRSETLKNETFTPDEQKLIDQYRSLTKRNRHRLEKFIEILKETQKN